MPDNVVILDGTGTRVIMASRFNGVAQIPTPLPYSTDGFDYSNHPQSLSGLNLLSTIAENELRAGFFIQSQDVGQLYVVMDDAAGSLTPTIVILDGAGATGHQGGSISMSGMPHMGRIRLYASSSTYQMAARTW